MSTCPACGHASTAKLFEVTADQASRSFVNPRQYPARSRELTHYLSSLWGRSTCDVRRCSDCGFGFADPFVAGGADFYNLAAPHPSYPTTKWEYARTIEELNGMTTAGKTIIDVGAGFGYFLDLVRDRLFHTPDIHALDYNQTALLALQSKGYKTFSVDLRDAAFDSLKGAFDMIFMFQVFEHMDRVDDVFARLKYLLKPQGSVFIAVPNDIRTCYMERHGSRLDVPPNHIGRWTTAAFEALCRRHGLQLSKCEHEPFNLATFLQQDIVDSFLCKAEKPGSVGEFVRGLPRSKAQRITQALVALAQSPTRLPAWAYAARNSSKLGSALWVKIDKGS
ncbi:class I SAM-dependent methyltransferase [Bradyrhizobium sp. B117]|uniref:class I SAM-dependent methyltransferase n=1 Tax=Bradyrhizobium sp. B117 TaxID=3140246 RepID=UPI003182C653